MNQLNCIISIIFYSYNKRNSINNYFKYVYYIIIIRYIFTKFDYL